MKKITLLLALFALVLFTSCDKKKELIKNDIQFFDYDENGDEVMTDLSVKINELEFIRDITGKDLYNENIEGFTNMSNRVISLLEMDIKSLQMNSVHYYVADKLDSCNKLLGEYRNNDFNRSYIRIHAEKINEYKNNPNKVYERVYNCIYTTKKPLPNSNVEEIRKSIYFNADETEIIGEGSYIEIN